MSALADFHEAFVAKLQADVPLEEVLPTYVARFDYYQRLFASALSRSLRSLMTMGGQLSINAYEWLEKSPRNPLRLVERG